MISYKINNSSLEEIKEHLNRCSTLFVPSLDSYVNIDEYSKKIFDKSIRFEAYDNSTLVSIICLYPDNNFITNVSSLKEYQGSGIVKCLMDNCLNYVGKGKIILEVNVDNNRAINFYKKYGFQITNESKNKYSMEITIKRNYNEEFKDTSDHKYAYNFDFDVMHPYMMKSFEPFLTNSDILELGSFKGDFTKHLLDHSNKYHKSWLYSEYRYDITCVEASSEAIEIAKNRFKDVDCINYYNSLFEDTILPKKYDNIILTHVLEHIDDPISLLSKIKNEWLSDNGKLFIVCPNANAPSRQIAVKMGLISHNSAITLAEKEHGHRITYSLDTLERDATEAELNVIHRSGIFFKALANFQWDRLLNTDIISKEYLDGCYKLGQQYPDLCSSIMLVCTK